MEEVGLARENAGEDSAGYGQQLGHVWAGQGVVGGGALFAGDHQVRSAEDRQLVLRMARRLAKLSSKT